MRVSEIIGVAVRAALYALRNPEPAASPDEFRLTEREWETMYQGQCEATDEMARRLRKAEQATGDAALNQRIRELEADLAKANGRIAELNDALDRDAA